MFYFIYKKIIFVYCLFVYCLFVYCLFIYFYIIFYLLVSMLIYFLYLEHIFRKNRLFKQKLKYIYIINYIHTTDNYETTEMCDAKYTEFKRTDKEMQRFAKEHKGRNIRSKADLTEAVQEARRTRVKEKGPPLPDGNRKTIWRAKNDAERASDIAAVQEAQQNWDAFWAERAPYAEAFNSARAAYQADEPPQAAYHAPHIRQMSLHRQHIMRRRIQIYI